MEMNKGFYHVVGDFTIFAPPETAANRNWLLFIIPATGGQVEVTVQILYPHIESALGGMKENVDVLAFLDAHRPFLSCHYTIL